MKTLGILIAAALCLATASAASVGVVHTEGGLVKGRNVDVGLFRWVDVFKGIPFAEQPGRFEKPKPHRGWDGILTATRYANRCVQVNMIQTETRGSEDCLYLNIWVPQGRKVSSDLPVMVWIFGGGFLVGGSMGANFLDNYLYSGEEIADRGNVIVVTIGYRVGTLGFLSTGDASLPGNYGLWDQHAAIAWVNRNIRAFGGDPNKITIFGESAGGASVSFQMLSPKNKGLIKRAITQSGVSLCSWALNRNPRATAEKVAKKVGCPMDDKMMACLKMTDAHTLTMAGAADPHGSPSDPIVGNLVFSPVIDGDFLPDDPSKLFHNAADIDYIAGANDMDGHLFSSIDNPAINGVLQDVDENQVKTYLRAFTNDKGQAALDSAFTLYSMNWGNRPSQEDMKKTLVEIGTDYIFLVPTQVALYLHSSNARNGRTYSYLLSEESRMGGIGKPYPRWMGADHADDLQYVFGKPFSTPLGYWPSHRDLSGYMIAYWTNFAQTGNPNKGESKVKVTWPYFTSTSHQYLELHSDMNKSYVKQKLRLRHVHWWSQLYPSLPAVKSSN